MKMEIPVANLTMDALVKNHNVIVSLVTELYEYKTRYSELYSQFESLKAEVEEIKNGRRNTKRS